MQNAVYTSKHTAGRFSRWCFYFWSLWSYPMNAGVFFKIQFWKGLEGNSFSHISCEQTVRPRWSDQWVRSFQKKTHPSRRLLMSSIAPPGKRVIKLGRTTTTDVHRRQLMEWGVSSVKGVCLWPIHIPSSPLLLVHVFQCNPKAKNLDFLQCLVTILPQTTQSFHFFFLSSFFFVVGEFCRKNEVMPPTAEGT